MNDDLIGAFSKLGNYCAYSAQEIVEGLEKFSQMLNGPQTSGETVEPNQKTDLEIFEQNGGKKEKVRIYCIEKIQNI